MTRRFVFTACVVLALSACGGGGDGASGSNEGGGATSPQPSPQFCSFMGSDRLMIGAQMEDVTAAAAPFDARYIYIASGLPPSGACMTSCSSSSDCQRWWGCWQDPAEPPGLRVRQHIERAAAATWLGVAHPQVPVFTYYQIYHAVGGLEGEAEVRALNNESLLRNYFDDWRFLLQQVGPARAMLHIEPDFWGFVRQVNSDPRQIPAPVARANPQDCAGEENNIAGFARCMIAMARKYAPHATVGLHASPWYSHMPGDGQALAQFMRTLGAEAGDFVATDPSDRDAGYYETVWSQDRWWNDDRAAAYLAWSRTLADGLGKPTILWQIPLGNMAQNNTPNHWRDNRVDYLFDHLPEVASAGIVALLFGAGQPDQTTPETDGGNLVAKTRAHWQAGGTPLCP